MRCWLLSLFKPSYNFEVDVATAPSERYQKIDEFQKGNGEYASKPGIRGDRRFAVLWEPVGNSTKSIPVFVKSEKDKDQIRTAIEKDDFLVKVIVGKRLQKVIDAMYSREVKVKEDIIKEGEPGKHLYIISEGNFEVSKNEKGVVGTLSVGRVFGELAILYNSRRQATVTAITAGKVWVLDREIYQTIVRRYNIEEKQERLVFLQKCPILNEVKDEILKTVAEYLHLEYFSTGKTIVRQGDPVDKFYIITAGSAAIMKDTEGLQGYLSKGNCFGEKAILSETTSAITVIAGDTGVECLTLARQHFVNHFGNIQDISTLSIPTVSVLTSDRVLERIKKYRKLKSSDFKIIQTIGEGGFARVEFIQHKKDASITFALKCLKRVEMIKHKQAQHVKNEKEIQMACESPFIVKLYKTEKDKKFLYFWLEVCLGGEVYKWLQNNRRRRFNEKSAKFVAACLLEALSYLHDRQIIYRDIKPENLLVDARGYVKLADFGFAKRLNPHTKTSTFAGTPEYVAPEIIASQDYDRAVDFWAYGVLIFELLNGTTPFASSDNDTLQIYRNIEKGFNKVIIPSHFSAEATSLIKSLLRHLPEERLGYQIGGTEKIKSHKWFADYDWKSLKECSMKSPLQPILKNNVDLRYMNIIKRKHSIPKEDSSNYFEDF